jgi:hypothetical protein
MSLFQIIFKISIFQNIFLSYVNIGCQIFDDFSQILKNSLPNNYVYLEINNHKVNEKGKN